MNRTRLTLAAVFCAGALAYLWTVSVPGLLALVVAVGCWCLFTASAERAGQLEHDALENVFVAGLLGVLAFGIALSPLTGLA